MKKYSREAKRAWAHMLCQWAWERHVPDREIARRLGVRAKTVANWMKGMNMPADKLIPKIKQMVRGKK